MRSEVSRSHSLITSKIFGSIANALNQSQNRDKFDEKGANFVLIGSSDEFKGYRLLNPEINQLVISRDVIFYEVAAWQRTSDTTQAPTMYDFIDLDSSK